MRVLNWHLDADVIDGFIAAVNSGQLGRIDLSRRLCELMKWHSLVLSLWMISVNLPKHIAQF